MEENDSSNLNNDLGLGSKATAGNFRTLNHDGTFNVRKINVPFYERVNFFHSLITMSWLRFFVLVVLGYLFINTLFASIYVAIGVEHLTGVQKASEMGKFMEAFFFSAQTITTLGYGRVAPVGMAANVVAAIESMLGLLTFALATGLLYGRFSKPNAKIKFSNQALVAPYRGINGFMFRLINPQDNQLMEVEVTLSVSMKRENSTLRDFHLLDLERSKVVFFTTVWTVVHPINEESPLYGLTEETALKKDLEFFVMIKAFDESFSQTVYSRTSYKAQEMEWGEKFLYTIKQEKKGIIVDVDLLSQTEKAPLN